MRIAVLYPRGQKTGGPEAMHQLVDELRGQGSDAYLCPHPTTKSTERASGFSHYDAPELTWDDLKSDDLLIGAEIYAHEIITSPTKHRVMWWLSADNADLFRYSRMVGDRYRRRQATVDGVPRLLARLMRERWWRWRIRRDTSVHHIVQSTYAADFVERWNGRRPTLVSDYVVIPEQSKPSVRKMNRVAYNPAKGGEIVAEVASGLQEMEFVPLSGLDSAGVADVLRSSAVYLDLGHHPGKDRIPREAAMLGCAVIVARRGSGALDADVPLPGQYKVASEQLVDDARRALRLTINALPEALSAQRDLRDHVTDERPVFRHEVGRFQREVAAFV